MLLFIYPLGRRNQELQVWPAMLEVWKAMCTREGIRHILFAKGMGGGGRVDYLWIKQI